MIWGQVGGLRAMSRLLGAAGAVSLLALAAALPAQAQLLPVDFFDKLLPTAGAGQAEVEADRLSYDMTADVITAGGGVVLRYQGFTARGERLVFNQRISAVELVGAVVVEDPSGNRYQADRIELTAGFKQAVLRSLSINTPQGVTITADDVRFSDTFETLMTNARYSPCGTCIDAKGRRIGWQVRAASISIDGQDRTIYLEDPVLELLGTPVAWLPFLSLPDPTVRQSGFRLPSLDYGEEIGLKLEVPYSLIVSDSAEILFTPALLSRQGALLGAEWLQSFDQGAFSVRGAGIYQLDPDAFEGEPGDREWRGMAQTEGQFMPFPDWIFGWSYTELSDAAFFEDYREDERGAEVNEIYGETLTANRYGRLSIQEFQLLGDDVTAQEQASQALALPNGFYDEIFELAPGQGRLKATARVVGVQREVDDTDSANGVDFVYGYAGEKLHGMVELGWDNQFVSPQGVLLTPYLGVRADAARYDGGSDLLSAPGETSRLSATPIAALDVRYPLIGSTPTVNYLFEPIGQVVYRGGDATLPGIVNDDAQSFVFEDSNLFSYNRFTGIDRQETGLRANLGAHYQVNFIDESWLDVVAGQSFFLAGSNGFDSSDGAVVSDATGLADDASYFVLGARGGISRELQFAGKAEFDVADARLVRAGLGGRYESEAGYTLGIEYFYLAEQAALGTTEPQHEVTGAVGVPIEDYWQVRANLSWDLAENTWLEAGGGIGYDDGYLLYGVDVNRTGSTHDTPNDTRVTASFKLKAPGNVEFGL